MKRSDPEAVWTGRPWIVPSAAARTVGAVALSILAVLAISMVGALGFTLLTVPLYAWVLLLVWLGWAASIGGLLVLRASWRYTLMQSVLEVRQGIARKKTLMISPSGFSELEVDQGIIARLMHYGTLEVRSQGGQRVTLELVRNPDYVSAVIRDVMTVPTVRLAKGEVAVPPQSTTAVPRQS
jgi:membrane protein YdbS with pleckstrin-like domain